MEEISGTKSHKLILNNRRTVKVKVLNLLDTTKKEEAKDLFEYI